MTDLDDITVSKVFLNLLSGNEEDFETFPSIPDSFES